MAQPENVPNAAHIVREDHLDEEDRTAIKVKVNDPTSPSTSMSDSTVSPDSLNGNTETKVGDIVTYHSMSEPDSPNTDTGHAELHPVQNGGKAWRETFWRMGPLAGIAAMLLALASIVAALGILVSSDGAAVTSWRGAEPSFFLAIITAIANLAIRYACIQGIVIAWWSRALGGSTLHKLHHDWRASTLVGALTAGKNIGLLGIATLFSTIVVVDGPLLQHSTSVRPAPIENEFRSVNVTMHAELPTNFSGLWVTADEINTNLVFNYAFNKTAPSADGPVSNTIIPTVGSDFKDDLDPLYYGDLPLKDAATGCPGMCKATIRAPALAIEACVTHTLPVNYSQDFGANEFTLNSVAMPLEQNLFSISTNIIVEQDNAEKINLITGFDTVDEDCVGIFKYTACSFVSAIGEYDVTVTQNAITCK
jgi:hypothetical protein